MKKLLGIFAPVILMIISISLLRQNHDILFGIYIIFPLIYISIGMSGFIELIVKLILTSAAFIIPINIWFHMGSCLELVFLYSFLAVVTYIVKQAVSKNKGKKTY